GMDTKVEPPPDFLATKTAASVGRCCPTLMSRSIIHHVIVSVLLFIKFPDQVPDSTGNKKYVRGDRAQRRKPRPNFSKRVSARHKFYYHTNKP
ncbi:MAG: hypothetical protein FWC50_10680, partial [Planctomycetaceae bacterium]|nr:hypothetical protein [Planctomycetaceae bacterium]